MGMCGAQGIKSSTSKNGKDDQPEEIHPHRPNPELDKNNTNIIINQNVLVQYKDNQNVYFNYKFSNLLGEGSFGQVEKVIHKKTNLARALKKINKKNANY